MVIMPIDMPDNCWDCPCHAEFGFCNLMIDTGDGDDYNYKLKCIPEYRDLRKNRRENCPLVEVFMQEATETKDTIEQFRKLFIKGDWSHWE